jgi:hypothetical protein
MCVYAYVNAYLDYSDALAREMSPISEGGACVCVFVRAER